MRFIQAKNYHIAARTSVNIQFICMHSMEAPEKPTTAEAVAQWFAGPGAPMASSHYCVDTDSIIQCVKEKDIAFGAKGGNSEGIHIELAGYAKQTHHDWLDDYSKKMLTLAAGLVADIANRHNIPLIYLGSEGINQGFRGITTHKDITVAKKIVGGHWDPGPGFPMCEFLGWASDTLNVLKRPSLKPENGSAG